MGLWNKKPADDGQSKSEADALIEKLGPVIGAAIEEKLRPVSESVNKLQTEWDGIKAEATRSSNDDAEAARRAAENNLTPEEKLANENKRLLMVSLLTNARITESEVLREVEGQWPGLMPRIREVLATIPMDDKVKADYAQRCRNAVKLVVGEEAMKGGLRQNADTKKFFLEDAAASTGGADSPFSDPDLTWTDERSGKTLTASQQLAKLHIDPKEFAEFVKRQGGLV